MTETDPASNLHGRFKSLTRTVVTGRKGFILKIKETADRSCPNKPFTVNPNMGCGLLENGKSEASPKTRQLSL
jgi:hypothetical protein